MSQAKPHLISHNQKAYHLLSYRLSFLSHLCRIGNNTNVCYH
jgi:hypothetical protein